MPPTTSLLRIVICAAVVAMGGCAPRRVAAETARPMPSAGAIEPIEVPFQPGALPRTAEFAGATFTVVGGEVTNLHPYTIFGEPKPGSQLFGVLTVQASNHGDSRIDYVFNEEAFRLRTYSGAILETVHPVGTYDFSGLAPGAADLEDVLVFPLRAIDELEGAALLIGKPPDEPAILELTAPPAGDGTQTISASAADVAVGWLSWTVVGGQVTLDRPVGVCCPQTGVRANTNERFVALTLRAVVRGSQYGQASISTDLVALLADGVAYESIPYLGRANVPEGQGFELTPVFLVDAAAERLQLRVSFAGVDSQTTDLEVAAP